MASKDEIYAKLKQSLMDMFDIPEEAIVPQAHLYKDLDIDSIDAIDLLVKLQDHTGRKVDPAQFRIIRTVQEVVDVLDNLMHSPDA